MTFSLFNFYFFFSFFLRDLETETLFQQNKNTTEKNLMFNSFYLNIKKKRSRIEKRFENTNSNQARNEKNRLQLRLRK